MSKKILFVIESYEPRYYIDAISWLVNNTTNNIYIYNLIDHIPSKNIFTEVIGINNYYNLDNNRPYYKSVFEIEKVIKIIKPDIIHAHMHNCAFFAQLALILVFKKIPLIYHKHSVFASSLKEAIMECFIFTFCTKVICVSKTALNYTIKKWFFFRRKISFIHNGINLNEDKSDDGIDIPDKYILLLARLRADKQHHIAIDAFDILAFKYPDIKLLIAGDGPYKDNIIEYARKKEFAKQILFTGHVNNISRVIKGSLFMLFPSKNESFGLVAVEGMAATKLVIAKNIGGLAETIKHNETGILIDSDEPEIWRKQIEYFLNNPIKRDELALAGYNNYILNYTSMAMAANYYKLYLDLLKNK